MKIHPSSFFFFPSKRRVLKARIPGNILSRLGIHKKFHPLHNFSWNMPKFHLVYISSKALHNAGHKDMQDIYRTYSHNVRTFLLENSERSWGCIYYVGQML